MTEFEKRVRLLLFGIEPDEVISLFPLQTALLNEGMIYYRNVEALKGASQHILDDLRTAWSHRLQEILGQYPLSQQITYFWNWTIRLEWFGTPQYWRTSESTLDRLEGVDHPVLPIQIDNHLPLGQLYLIGRDRNQVGTLLGGKEFVQ